MDKYLNYLIEANIGLLLFLVCYYLVLRKETNYRFARFFLMAGLVTSVLFPLIDARPEGEASPFSVGGMLPTYWLPSIDVAQASTVDNDAIAFASDQWLWMYSGVTLLLSLSLFLSLGRIIQKIRISPTYRRDNVHICESREEHPTFSFFNFIFLGKADQLSPSEKEHILRHEMVHVRHFHSLDIMMLQCIKVIFWFNPLLYFYKKAVTEVHEFEADAVASRGTDSDEYCRLLAKISLQSNGFKLANHFSHSLTVKRIAMIRTVSNRISLWKAAICCLFIPCAFFLLSCQDQLEKEVAAADGVPSAVDKHAYPDGGFEGFYKELRMNVRYPASSRKHHHYGQVLVQFVVNEDGTLSDFEVLESPDEALADEGLRVLSLSREWIPAKKAGVAVKEKMVMPLKFLLDGAGNSDHRKSNDEEEFKQANRSLKEIVVVGYTVK